MLSDGQKRYRKYKKSYDAYRNSHKKLIKKLGTIFRSKYSFDGKRESILKRDNYACKKCGMTNEEHIEKWGRELTVDHIDGNGRYSSKCNNKLSNLQTLCLSCHGKKDIVRRKYRPVIIDLKNNK